MQLPRILGIVNITEDSFSDGGAFLAPESAIARARQLLADGADIVDLGPAASNPDARPVSAAEERRRLEPVITALAAAGASVSIDSLLSETQLYAISRGVAFLNDIQGFPDAALYPALAAARARLIVMHSVQQRGNATRADVPADGLVERILRFFEERIGTMERAGIARDRIIIDPGMGYFLGARPEASFRVLAELPRLKAAFGLPVLVSLSRKSFLRATVGRSAAEIGAATLAAELCAALAGADYIRTHDAAALRDGLRVLAALDAAGDADAAHAIKQRSGRR